MTSGRRFARAVYRAVVYPAGPLPTMITFSTSDTASHSLSTLTLLCIVARRGTLLRACGHRGVPRAPLGAPARDALAQLEVGDRARHRRQPERKGAIGDDRGRREVEGHAERHERPD